MNEGTVRQSKEASILWSHHEETRQMVQETMSGACRRGRLRTAWMDHINMWTGLSVEESIRMTENRDKWRKYVYGVANPGIKDGKETEQNTMRRSCAAGEVTVRLSSH